MFILKLATLKKLVDKKTLLRAAAIEGCTQLFEGFQIAFDKKRVFNIKSAPLIEIDNTMTQQEIMETGTYTWDMFKALIKLLEKNELDNKTKKDLLYEAAEESGILEWNAFYRPIIMKNMKCNVTPKTINAVLSEFGVDTIKYKIPIWKIQKISDGGLFTGKKYIEPLLYGKRAITIIDKDLKTAKIFSETGVEIKTHDINLESLSDLSYQFPESIMLDGCIIKRDYDNLMNKDIKGEYYTVFDIMLLSDFNQSYCPMTLQNRRETLNELNSEFREISMGQIYVLPTLMLDLKDEISKNKLKEFEDEVAMAGYKAIVLKDINSHYTCGKDLSWYKKIIDI